MLENKTQILGEKIIFCSAELFFQVKQRSLFILSVLQFVMFIMLISSL